ncbi:gamma-glutamyl-gamma-aminobutyrate hydrolase [Solibacillus sp. R5-41]|uniref:gamma-glutamyl-gamma-aminobutyrate hydrolase family protein n=1 Tax=Solibacillus sp. R5-41 TaxID=2048654 RepID=UPI000C127DF6|nr:gamma-glutamyl-gamma-aminobutyrate hydrolase family protein [Solibacillus sp. R5-41]ATP41168.1 gamma-glutamyl-gamma-aminobutyrate hydrolase [Solibacillus sp. R5-41]
MKPVIGLTMHPVEGKKEINNTYINAIKKAGGTPICLPVINEENIEQVLDIVDGVVSIGGYDVNPLIFGQEPHFKLGVVIDERDKSDMLIMKRAFEREIPILGICRGEQVMNVAFGGTLYQDIDTQVENVLKHTQVSLRHEVTHTVELEPSKLQQIVGAATILTNSFHHQAIDAVADGFIINARAKDGVIEGIEHPTHPYCIGVQWHPEGLENDAPSDKLFKSFIDASTKK